MYRIIVTLFLAAFLSQAHAQVKYVKANATGANDGSSWANAYTDLQSALNTGTEIWIAAGTYYPSVQRLGGAYPRSRTFTISSNKKLYGGFNGTETLRSQRDPAANATILSGNINNVSVATDNCYWVVYMNNAGSASVLDGLIIRDGYANLGSNAYGAGAWIENSSPTINNCTFVSNLSTSSGGAIYCTNNSNATISNCTFSSNITSSGGGAIYNEDSSPTISNCSFSSNQASYGGAVYNLRSAPTVSDCTVSGNSGGGISSRDLTAGGASPSFTDCRFIGNTTGSGLTNTNINPEILNCAFVSNSTSSWGGGMSNSGSTITTSNCIFWGNTATNEGGAVRNYQSGGTYANCTFVSNTGSAGGGIYNQYSSPTIVNSIIWNNSSSISNTTSSPSISYSNVQGGYAGTGNINADPSFFNISDPDGADNIYGTADDGLYPDFCPGTSVNVGNNAAIPSGITTDFSGNTRTKQVTVDMGAYEHQSDDITVRNPNYIYVAATGFNTNGASWDCAYHDLGSALAAASGGDTIVVKEGTYKPTSGTDRSISFVLKEGVVILGGFVGTEVNASERDWQNNETILSGEIGTASESDNSYHVVTSNSLTNAVLDGFTITKGYADEITNGSVGTGGGMHNTGGTPTVSNCYFTANRALSTDEATGGGAAMFNTSSAAPIITNCTFHYNHAKYGGGMRNESSSPSCTNCTFTNNNGGGASNYGGAPVFTDCTFNSNRAPRDGSLNLKGGGMTNSGSSATVTDCSFTNTFGSGMYNFESPAQVTSCAFTDNEASDYGAGGGIDNENSTATILGCTFSGNSTESNGGGISCDGAAVATVDSCVFASNTARSGGGMYFSGNANVTNSIFTSNSASGFYASGGGVAIVSGSPSITNCTFLNNSASYTGSSISCQISTSDVLSVKNASLVTSAVADDIFTTSSASLEITYSCVEGGYTGTGNVDVDPEFVDNTDPNGADNVWRTADDGLRLGACSPLLNSGTNTGAPSTDILGATRIYNTTVDMGAYESRNNCVLWTGTTSTDWNTASNWSPAAVPGSNDTIQITSAPGNQPHVTAAPTSPAVCSDLILRSGTLTVDAGKALTVNGNTTNNGIILVKADATGIGSLITQGTISGSGASKMEQYLTGSGGATPNGVFYYVSSPVNGNYIYDYNVDGDDKLWTANESTQSYTQQTVGAVSMVPTVGYVARMGSTQTITFNEVDQNIHFNTGNQSASGLTRTGTTAVNRGYNLVGNPYPSTVSWDDASRTNLETTLWYRTHQGTTMLYDTYNSSGMVGTNNNGSGAVTGAIPPTQAFWVRVNADGNTGSLSFDNADRSHGSLAGIYKTEAEEGTIRMSVSNGSVSDETILLFNAAAQDGFDDFDSQKFWAGASVPQLYTTVGTDSLVINGLSSTLTNPTVPLGVKLPTQGNYSLNANSISVIGENVHLEDTYLGIFQDLNVEPNYAFTSAAGNIGDRFVLHFGMAAVGIEDGQAMNSRVYTSNGNQLNIILSENTEKGSVEVLDMTGRVVYTSNLNALRSTINLNASTGVYLIRVETEKGTDTHRVILN